MPRRRGRGGSRHGSREKAAASERFSSKKRRGKSRGKPRPGTTKQLPVQDMPELADLQENSFRPSMSSMNYNARRPGRLVDEIDYTDSHHDETMKKPLRSRPLVFVKAKEVYDPSADLFKRSKKYMDDRKSKEQLLSILEAHDVADDDSDLSHIDESDEDISDVRHVDEPEEDTGEVLGDLDNTRQTGSTIPTDKIEPKQIPSNIPLETGFKNGFEPVNNSEEPAEPLRNIESHTTNATSNITESSKTSNAAEDEISLHLLRLQDENAQEVSFVVDEEPDDDLDEFPRESIAALLRSKFLKNDLSQEVFTADPIEEGGLEYDPVLTIGKVSLSTKRDEHNNVTTELMALDSLNKVTTKGFVDERAPLSFDSQDSDEDEDEGYQDYVDQVMRNMREDSDYDDDEYESDTNFDIMAPASDDEDIATSSEDDSINGPVDEPEDPEYGFLPEDFEFDVSQISVTNVRFGIQNQYYTKNQDLTGDDFLWIDEDDLFEYVLLKGVKEHRLKSFLRYVTGGLIDEQPQAQPDYSDVYISETSEEEEESENELDLEEDDLKELLSFAKSLSKSFVGTDQMVPTETVKTKGKGKNKQLDLDNYDLDSQIFESLQDQYQIHRERKKNKKNRKDEEKREQAMKNHDLLVKYPYSLHIKEIRNEFELFLHDSLRDTLSFPPLDPHGSKTLIKMAKCYNMKAMRCGPNGLKLYIKATKFKGTYHYLPKYNEIGHMLKQRPIFNRTDQKRPRDEIVDTDGNAQKDRARGRNKNQSKANVREGDIVGALAPEISRDNIGRQLLEKLGWKAGEGLGAIGNQGINEPVKATVKTTKTGLK